MSDSTFQPPPPPVLSVDAAPPQAPRPAQYRPFAIGLFILGVILIGLGVAKIVSFGTGAAVAFFGVLLFALSFIRLPMVAHEEQPLPFIQKLLGIFYEPTRVFKNLRVFPRWVGAMIVIALLVSLYQFLFVKRITPERIVNHQAEKMADMGALTPPPEVIEKTRTDTLASLKSPVEQGAAVIKTVVFTFFAGAFVAAIIMLATLAFGGRINYWQAMSAYFYANLPIIVIQKGLSLILLYIKSPDDLHPVLNQETLVQDNLGILFSPAAHPILFVLTSFIGLTSFYGLWLRAKGLQTTGTKVSSTAGWGVSITLWLLLLFFVLTITALFPGFIS